ncbi:Insulin-like growth factor 2 mRNA-binding protein 3 [Chamberlinius hualienensis]
MPSLFNEDSYDYLFKIVVIGDCDVGKTCVVQRFKAGTFVEYYRNTIGVDFAMKEVIIDNKRIKLQLWDTAGQERFRTITQSYYRSAHGVLLVYDISKRATFINIQRWMDEVRKYTDSNVLVLLAGNKCDLEEAREVESVEAHALAEGYEEIISVIETSAKEDTNISQAMITLAKQLKDQQSRGSGDIGQGMTNDLSLKLGGQSVESSKFSCC